MQTLICNVCERALDGTAYEFSTITGEPVAGQQGLTQIARRRHVRLLHLCARCGNWLDLGIRTIAESLAAANAVRRGPGWLDPGTILPVDYTISTDDGAGHP